MAKTSSNPLPLLVNPDDPPAVVSLLESLRCSHDPTNWLAIADALEEAGQSARADLVRTTFRYQYAELTIDEFTRVGSHRRHLLYLGVKPCVPTVEIPLGMLFALIPAGEFTMGEHPGIDYPMRAAATPAHQVVLTRPYWLGVYPVTQSQYETVTMRNPSFHRGDLGHIPSGECVSVDWPVDNVSFYDAENFCYRLSALYGCRFRLPTEAEWERACRAGAAQEDLCGDDDVLTLRHANFTRGEYDSMSVNATTKVGSYPPNAFGLYDMRGNVWEWCQDWFDPEGYPRSRVRDPQGPKDGQVKAVRGGCFSSTPEECRSANREPRSPDVGDMDTGFRVVLELP